MQYADSFAQQQTQQHECDGGGEFDARQSLRVQPPEEEEKQDQ